MLEKITSMLGIQITQYRYLLQTEKTVTKRALKGLSLGSNILNYVFGFLISFSFFFIPFLTDISIYNFALIGITLSMVMIGIWMLPYFDILIYPINYPIVAHTPISSRTYFFVKLTQMLSQTVKYLICLNLIPAISGIWVRSEESPNLQFLFPLVYLTIAFISGIFTVGIMTTCAGYLTKLYVFKRLRNLARFTQGLFPLLFPATFAIFYFLPDDIPDEAVLDVFSRVAKLFILLPNGWFAATVSVILGQIEVIYLILTALAILSTTFFVLVPIQNIAKTYTQYLSYLMETDTKKKSLVKVKTSKFAKIIKTRNILAGFCLSSIYSYREKWMLHNILAMLGGIIYFAFMLTQAERFNLGWTMKSYIIGLNLAFFAVSIFLGVGLVSQFLTLLRYSAHWKASWMFKAIPLTAPLDLWRGAQLTTLVYVVMPYTLFLCAIAIFIWGGLGVFFVLPTLVFVLYHVLFLPKPPSALPLSEEKTQKIRGMGCAYSIYVHLSMIVYVGIFFIAYWIDTSVYISVYCIIVVAGLVGFVYLFRKKPLL